MADILHRKIKQTCTLLCILLTFFTSIHSLALNNWIPKANFSGSVRTSTVGFSILDKGYVGTGIDSSGILLNDFWRYDPSSDTWAQIADFAGTARIGAIGFSIDSLGYLGLGDDGNSLKKDLWQYNPQSNTWLQVQDLGMYSPTNTNGRKDASVAVGSGKAYVICGYDGSTTYSKQCWQFDPLADTSWTIRKNFMNASDFTLIGRRWGIAFSLNSQIYFGTGFDHTQNYKNDFWKYNPFTDTWNQLPSVPGQSRSNASGFALEGMGYVCCGENLSQQTDVWKYDPSLNNWTMQNDYPGFSSANNISFVINNRAFVGLGNDSLNAYQNDFWEFTPDTLTSLLEIPELFTVHLFPNPSKDYIIFRINSFSPAYPLKLRLYTQDGKLKLFKNLVQTETRIELKNFSAGVYYYSILDNNNRTFRGKMHILNMN